jgi:HEAT repeat protein
MQYPQDPQAPKHEATQLESSEDQELAGEVGEIITALLKAVRAQQTYVAGNPLLEKFQAELAERFGPLWDRLPHLTLAVDEGNLVWNEFPVYSKPVGPDNFAFRFFKDGIRSLAFLPGAEGDELDEFVSIVARSGPHDEDLVATLWHRDFTAIRMEYVDISEDEGLEIPTADRAAGAGESLSDMSEIQAVLDSGAVPEEEEEAEYADLSLEEADLIYLRREMEAEWSRPLVRDVVLALLDQFEMRDQERRRQVVDILREFLPDLLSARDYENVALIVNELQLLANKTGELETQQLVASLLSDMSEAMAELVSAGGRDAVGPDAGATEALLGALQAEAIPTLVRAIPAMPGTAAREQLGEALDRLVSAHPQHITQLLVAEDPVLAAEAARIVGRLGIQEAETALVELAGRPGQLTRQAAIEALAAIGSLAGVEALAAALEDESRDVRLAAVQAILVLKPKGADQILRKWVTSPQIANRDQSEQVALFKAYATVGGEGAVSALDKLLNGRRWWGGRRSPTLRASAARALGFSETEEARQVLLKAQKEGSTAVQSAVRVALRSFDSGSRSEDPISREDVAGAEAAMGGPDGPSAPEGGEAVDQ